MVQLRLVGALSINIMKQSITLERVFGFLAVGIVFLNFTNVYTFLAGLTGISFSLLAMSFMAIMAAYVLSNVSTVFKLFQCRPIVWFLVLFVVLPIISSIYAPYFSMRYIGYNVNFGLMFLVSIIWIHHEGSERFSKLLLLSWGICILGIVLSYFIPHVFERVALAEERAAGGASLFSNVRVAQTSAARAFGFQMQSNRAAFNVIVHLLLLVPISMHDRPTLRLLLIGVSFGAILLTGSRGGFMLIALFCCLIAGMEMLNGLKVRGKSVSRFMMIPKYGLFVALGVAGMILIQAVAVSTQTGETAIGRIFNTLFSSDYEIGSDGSVLARLDVQRLFIHQIVENPIIGRGLASDEFDRHAGRLPLSAHNNFLDLAYQFGIPVMLAMYGLLFYVCTVVESRRATHFFCYNISWLIMIIIFSGSMLSNTVIEYRVFPVLVAFWFMLIYFPSSKAPRRLV